MLHGKRQRTGGLLRAAGVDRREEPSRMIHRSGVILKSPREIELIRAAGRVVHRVLLRMQELAKPGVTTGELNVVAEALIDQAGAEPLFKGVRNPQARCPFPAALCTSVNEQLVHGVPGPRALVTGDVLSIDCGVRLAGYCGDAATTLPIGAVSPAARHLLDVTRGALDLALELIRPGRLWSEIATSLQAYVEGQGLSVVRDFVGHGIGREMHEEPKVPNYWAHGQKALDFELVPRMVLAVEPMVTLGSHLVRYGDNSGWVVVTRDGRAAAHFEHTLAVTEDGVDVLTDGR